MTHVHDEQFLLDLTHVDRLFQLIRRIESALHVFFDHLHDKPLVQCRITRKTCTNPYVPAPEPLFFI